MLLDNYKELTPVFYGTSGLKVLYTPSVSQGNHCYGMHWHERMELNLIEEGSMAVRVGNAETTLRAGELAIITPEQLHYGAAGEEGVSYYTIMFDMERFQSNLPVVKNLLTPLIKKQTSFLPWTGQTEIVSVFREIVGLNRLEQSCDSLMAIGKVYELLALLYRFCLLEETVNVIPSDRFRDVLSHINEHYTEDISSESLSRKFGYSAGYFSRHFKEVTGISPMVYIRILRLEKAGQLLLEQKFSVGEIAVRCGFNDVSYFVKCFKNHFHMTPTEYGEK